jgi:glycosyltransferase involved in cell wall biosynthesis
MLFLKSIAFDFNGPDRREYIMKDCLVMLTKTFPFDKGEEFIEDELPVLAKAFDRIILLATSAADHAVQTRSVPKNVTVCVIRASAVKHKLPQAAAKMYFSRGMHGFAGKEEYAGKSSKKRVSLAYLAAKSEIVFDECSRALQPLHLEQYAGVTFYAYWFFDVAAAAVQLKKCCTAKVCRAVCRAHGYDIYQERLPFGYLPLRPYLLKNLDAIYPCSDDGTAYINQHWPGFTDKVHTAHLGTADFGLGPVPDDSSFHIVSCCHIVPLKRVKLLAESLALLKDSSLKLKWTHIGDGDELAELRAYAKENLSFMETDLSGAKSNAELMQFYQSTAVDLFVNTSSSEGLPVSIMEAASFGIPTIATDVGGTKEIVHTGENGWLLPADISPTALAETIRQAAQQSPAQKQQMRESSRYLWETSFQAESNFQKFAQDIQPL